MADQALDAELMASAQRGDREALETLVRSYYRAVYSYARRVLRDEELASEVTQDTFTRVFRYRASWKPDSGSVRSWIFAVAANRIRDARKARREEPAPIEGEVAAAGETGLALFARGALREEVARALDELDPTEREVLALKYLSDLSYEEVAKALGVSVSAAKMRALRARDALAARVKRLVADSEDGE
jgi:RNA polymerase sigma factor (sigma-70 family)